MELTFRWWEWATASNILALVKPKEATYSSRIAANIWKNKWEERLMMKILGVEIVESVERKDSKIVFGVGEVKEAEQPHVHAIGVWSVLYTREMKFIVLTVTKPKLTHFIGWLYGYVANWWFLVFFFFTFKFRLLGFLGLLQFIFRTIFTTKF